MTEPASPDDAVAPTLGPSLDFLRVVWAVDHGLQRMSKWMEAWLGITGPQRLVIRIVGKHPGLTAGALAQVLHIHPSTLTGILKRLEARGLIHRQVDGRDARRSLIALSDKGKQFDVETEGTIESTVARVLSTLSSDETTVARKVLEALSHGFSEVAARHLDEGATPPPRKPRRPRAGKAGKAGPGRKRRKTRSAR